MGRRWLVGIGVFLAIAGLGYLGILAAWVGPEEAIGRLSGAARPPIVVGLLHSKTGPMAISERSLIDAETLAIEEINDRGGIAGRRIEARAADGRSDVSAFADEARRLIDVDKASVLFGCYTAEVRKAVQAVVEERRGLLFVPGNFEGMERSSRTLYAGGSANQTVPPAVRWAIEALKARRFFVVASEEVWSRSVAEFAKDAIKANGAELVGESYLPMGATDVEAAVATIKATRPDVVLNSMLGETLEPFYAALGREGLTPEKSPVLSFSVAEDELRVISPGLVAGHYSAWNYFQAVDRKENREFIRRFKARFGQERVTSDAIVSAYDAVMLWAQTVDELGSPNPDEVVEHLGRQSFDAPDSVVTIDPESHVFWRQFHVGRARADGQFDIVSSITKPVRPTNFLGTRPREQWRAMLEGLRAGWGGRWSSTASTPASAAPAPAPAPPTS